MTINPEIWRMLSNFASTPYCGVDWRDVASHHHQRGGLMLTDSQPKAAIKDWRCIGGVWRP